MALRFVPAKGVFLPQGSKEVFGPTQIQWPGSPPTKVPAYIINMAVSVNSVLDGVIGPHGRTRGMDQATLTQFGPVSRRGRQEISPTLVVNDGDVVFTGRRGRNVTWTMPNYLIELRGGLDVTYTIDGVDYNGQLVVEKTK